MKIIEQQLLNSLEQVMSKWLEDNSSEFIQLFDNIYLGQDTSYYMAQAAWSVLAALQEAQQAGMNAGDLFTEPPEESP